MNKITLWYYGKLTKKQFQLILCRRIRDLREDSLNYPIASDEKLSVYKMIEECECALRALNNYKGDLPNDFPAPNS